jgi:hypothetical protein
LSDPRVERGSAYYTSENLGTRMGASCGDVAFALFLYLELLGPKVF